MAYSVSNPPRQILSTGLSTGSSMWLYESTDPHTTVDDPSYFSDGTKHGMKLGDIVIVRKTDDGSVTLHSVSAVAAAVGTGAAAQAPRAVTISAAVLA